MNIAWNNFTNSIVTINEIGINCVVNRIHVLAFYTIKNSLGGSCLTSSKIASWHILVLIWMHSSLLIWTSTHYAIAFKRHLSWAILNNDLLFKKNSIPKEKDMITYITNINKIDLFVRISSLDILYLAFPLFFIIFVSCPVKITNP